MYFRTPRSLLVIHYLLSKDVEVLEKAVESMEKVAERVDKTKKYELVRLFHVVCVNFLYRKC